MSKRIRIALLADYPLFLLDGQVAKPLGHYATWLVSLYELLAQQEAWEVHWLVLQAGEKKARAFVAGGQFFHVLPRLRKTVGLYTFYLYERAQVRRCLAGIDPQLVHAWGSEDCYALAGADFVGPRLLSIQGLLSRCVALAPMNCFTRHHSMYEYVVLRRYCFVTGESPYALQHLAPLARQAELRLLEYAVDECFFKLDRNLSPSPCFLYVGTMTPRKNVGLLLDVFARPELAGVPLYLAGVRAEQLPPCSDNVIALGRVGRQELCNHMAQSWGLLCPSLTETGPTVVKEARVVGLPVVLSTECGSAQYVQQGESGFIIDPRDGSALLQAVLLLSRNAGHNSHMGQSGREACRAALSPGRMLISLQQIYADVLGGAQ